MNRNPSRRRLLAGGGAAAVAGLAGCVGQFPGLGGEASDGRGSDGASNGAGSGSGGSAEGNRGPPTADADKPVPHALSDLRDAIVSGGVSRDGIPSVDDPQFQPAAESELRDGAVVFGVARGDDARAYPQHVLVYHEIVNDTLAGAPVSVTYCPLTGTAMGFERGETTFGVSGRLVNNNLVMYDRATESRWPQMLATAISGPKEGDHLREFRLVWTTWGAWRAAHPDTRIMTSETGYARRYGRDPYGGYNPDNGYYDSGPGMFSSLHADDRAPPKRVVVGARAFGGEGTPGGSDGSASAVAFDKPTLREVGVLSGSLGGRRVVTAYDPALDTAYVHAPPDDVSVEAAGDGTVRVDGETHRADDLPGERVYAFDAMWHAWSGFYPETNYVR